MNAIETYELTRYFSRGKVQALVDCTLEVQPGCIFSLLGPNGAGKTTLIKMLIGILYPTRGQAKLLGHPLGDYAIHARLGYLAENHRFPEFLTAAQVLWYFGKMSGLTPNQLKIRIPELLTQMKINEWANTRIRKFSKGMLQRLGLAQALLANPDLIFLDEPTDGIDPVGRREVRDLLKSLRDAGKTIFLNSHLLSEVERVSDEIAILKQGRLIQKGTVSEFITVRQQYQIRLEPGKQSIQTVCAALAIPLVVHDGLHTVAVQDDAQLNHLIDHLRAQEILIQAIIPRKITLEDFFIEVIADKSGVAA
ncbi:ABC transporter ATP-binding protein [candidate division KSB1 bacterium]|nr:ABC transporter ATP-binding protein [candidate division KSB1 bacterium]